MSDITLKRIDNDIRDVIQNLFEIQSATYGYLGTETQHELMNKMRTLTLALKRLSEDTKPLPDPSQVPEVKDTDDPPLHSISLPPEIIDYVDSSRNPDIYTREFVELVQRGNQDLKGKAEAFADFRDILAKEMAAALPELKGEIDRTLEGVGEGPLKDPDTMPVTANVRSQNSPPPVERDRPIESVNTPNQ